MNDNNLSADFFDATEIAKRWMNAKKKLEEVEKTFKELDESLKKLMQECKLKSIKVGTETIEISTPSRRSFDAEMLKTLVSSAVFSKITKPTVDTQLMDAAIKLGTIKPEVADQVTKHTNYTQLRVK